jgi:Icc-related predicted phosphoesterase
MIDFLYGVNIDMKLHVLSDLHLEFFPITLPKVERDVLILAGDIHIGLKALPFIEKECKKGPVIYILGNHEYYHNDFRPTLEKWRHIKIENFYFLENSEIELNGFHFFGTTLWTDMNNGNEDSIVEAMISMSDYNVIQNGESALTAYDTIDRFHESLGLMKQFLQQHDPKKSVIITHHLPSEKSIASQFTGDPLNYAFMTNLDPFIQKTQPILWIHGHTHFSFDYYIGATRIVCNPRGYATSEPNVYFKNDLIIEFNMN